MISKVKKKLEIWIKTNKAFNIDAYSEVRRERNGEHSIHDNRYHLEEAIAWLRRAQDATPDKGVARGYSMAWDPYFQSKGWQPSYPETTGYIIPTFFDCATYFDDQDLFQRAVEMANWEIDIQMKNGAVRGGVISEEKPVPSVFCTGQVIFGWLRAYHETDDIGFMNAAKKAGDFLLKLQDENGQLVEDNRYNFANKDTTVYHTRVAWSLVLLGKIANNEKYLQAGIRNIEYNLKYQEKNGWFGNNCLTDPRQPLLHTICYAIRGTLEAGILLNNDRFIEAAKLAADHVLHVNEKGEYLSGRYNMNWEGTVSWSCLTGDAQLAIIWLKLYKLTRNSNYLKGTRKIIAFLKTTQNCSTSNMGLRGGIKGSYPFGGNYGKFQILNWATKFYVDALLLESLIQENKCHEKEKKELKNYVY